MITDMAYLWLKTLHIVLAIVAVGFNISYGLLIGRARRAGRVELTYALRTVKVMDDYVANPAYVLLLVTGIGMLHLSGIPFSTRWVHVSMALLLVALAIGAGLYTPTLRKQIALLETRGPDDADFRRVSARGQMLGGILGVIVLVIIWLMVFKPS
jgi:uncharacterized membrane protein